MTLCPSDPRAVRFLARVRSAIAAEFSSAAFSVEMLADALGISSRQLSRRLASLSGETPAEAIRRQRLVRAADLLTEGQVSVDAVVRAVGFTSPSGFRRAFQAAYGVTPLGYRAAGVAARETSAPSAPSVPRRCHGGRGRRGDDIAIGARGRVHGLLGT